MEFTKLHSVLMEYGRKSSWMIISLCFLSQKGQFSVFRNVTQIWEGWAYIGLSSILAIIFYFSLLIQKWVNHKKFSFNQQWIENKHLQYAIIASILLLIFSMAYPFKLYKPSLDWFSVLKQFRAVGRFAWVFYFVITISSVYFIDIYNRHLRKNGKKIISIFLVKMITKRESINLTMVKKAIIIKES